MNDTAPKTNPAPSQLSLIGRMLQLAWRYRLGSLRVLIQQLLVVMLSMAVVGLTGLGLVWVPVAR